MVAHAFNPSPAVAEGRISESEANLVCVVKPCLRNNKEKESRHLFLHSVGFLYCEILVFVSLSFFLKSLSICLHVLLCTTNMPMSPGVRRRYLNALELRSPVVMSCHLVLGTEPQTSARAASILTCGAISTAHS